MPGLLQENQNKTILFYNEIDSLLSMKYYNYKLLYIFWWLAIKMHQYYNVYNADYATYFYSESFIEMTSNGEHF